MIMLIIFTFYLLSVLNGYDFSGNIERQNQNNYGPYVAKWTQYDICRGPKAKNLTSLDAVLLVEDNTYRGAINFTFLVTTRIEEVKIAVYNYKGNIKNLLWNYKFVRPCQHFVVGNLLKEIGAENCIVKKGNYYTIINLTQSTYQFFGTSFFYGNYLFKITLLCKSGNIACFHIHTIFSKKQ